MSTRQYLNKVVCGDSAELLSRLDTGSIDLVVTSPPYDQLRDYTSSTTWNMAVFRRIARKLYRVMKPGGVVVWVVGDMVTGGNKSLSSYRQALYFQEIGFQMFDVIIYEKAGAGPPHPNRYFNSFEYMFILSKGTPKSIHLLRDKPNKWAGKQTFTEVTRREKDGSLTNKGRKTIQPMGVRTNIWRYSNGKGFATKDDVAYRHPAIFPEKLAEDHILSWSDEGDVVLDPFGGSGTVAKMATLLNRQWISMDVSAEYCAIAEERLGGLSR